MNLNPSYMQEISSSKNDMIQLKQVDSKSTTSLPMTGSLPLPEVKRVKAKPVRNIMPEVNYYENNVINVNNVVSGQELSNSQKDQET